MKKLIFSAGVMLAMLAACETQDELAISTIAKPGSEVLKPDSAILIKPDSIAGANPDSISVTKPDSVVISKPDSVVTTPPVVITPPVVTTPVEPAPVPESPVVVTPPSVPITPAPVPDPVIVTPTPGSNNFNIIFSQTFDKNTPGNYKESEWRIDWKNPAWANHKYGYGKISLEGTNKYLMLPHYAGSFGAGDGYQWETKLGKGYNEVYFSYRIKFSSGFATDDLDGKLPGMGGGSGMSPGKLPNGTSGWGGKYMFKGTQIKFYLYYAEMYKLAGDATPVSGKAYYGQGPYLNPGYKFKPGVWYTITQRVVMNTVGKADGLVEGYVNGKLVCAQTGLKFRTVSTLSIDKINFGNFFGGSGSPPSKDEAISFDDFYVYTYNSSVNVARGNVSNPTGTTIILPNQ